MFNSSKKLYTIYKPVKTKDSYNQEIIEWEEMGQERVFISLSSHKSSDSDGYLGQQVEWIGVVALPSSIDEGWKVGDYEVTFVVDTPRERFLYLSNYGR